MSSDVTDVPASTHNKLDNPAPLDAYADSRSRHELRTDARTIVEALDEQAAKLPDKPFLIFEGTTISFSQMRASAVDIAGRLSALGLAAGERVAILAENQAEVVEVNFAAAYGGFISVPIGVFLKGEFLRHQLANSGAAAVIADPMGAAALTPLLQELPELRYLITLHESEPVAGFGGIQHHLRRLPAASGDWRPHQPSPLDPLQILYTSGTTGSSKGCVLSHASRMRVGFAVRDVLEMVDDDVQLGVAPMFHMGGQMNLIQALCTGTTLVLERSFSASRLLDRAREVGATLMGGVGTFANFLINQPATDRDRDHRIRAWLAVPLPPEAEATMWSRFGIKAISQFYAQTEAMPITSGRLSSPDLSGTAGRPLTDISVAILDDNDNRMPQGEVGEIALRPEAPGVMFSEYWNNPTATLESWRSLWHHTGDLGKFDENGALVYVDRKKDSMRRRGENVSAFELELILRRFGPISEAAAIAARHPEEFEDEIKACIVLEPGEVFNPADFHTFMAAHVPYFAMPRFVDVLDELPKNPTGRVMKFVLRDSPTIGASTYDLKALGLYTGRKPKDAGAGAAIE
jgi:carnitine-CoA ligase